LYYAVQYSIQIRKVEGDKRAHKKEELHLGGVNRGPHGGDSTGIGIRRLTGFGKAQ
jgi:hypothetical protein